MEARPGSARGPVIHERTTARQPHPQPPGRAPKGEAWNSAVGCWVAKPQAPRAGVATGATVAAKLAVSNESLPQESLRVPSLRPAHARTRPTYRPKLYTAPPPWQPPTTKKKMRMKMKNAMDPLQLKQLRAGLCAPQDPCSELVPLNDIDDPQRGCLPPTDLGKPFCMPARQVCCQVINELPPLHTSSSLRLHRTSEISCCCLLPPSLSSLSPAAGIPCPFAPGSARGGWRVGQVRTLAYRLTPEVRAVARARQQQLGWEALKVRPDEAAAEASPCARTCVLLGGNYSHFRSHACLPAECAAGLPANCLHIYHAVAYMYSTWRVRVSEMGRSGAECALCGGNAVRMRRRSTTCAATSCGRCAFR